VQNLALSAKSEQKVLFLTLRQGTMVGLCLVRDHVVGNCLWVANHEMASVNGGKFPWEFIFVVFVIIR
jgi:hypothetical protein